METVKVGDHVIIQDQENRYYGKGALVVSWPLACAILKVETQVVAVKVFSQEWDLHTFGEWRDVILIVEVSHLKPDTEQVYEMSRLAVKFGDFWRARLKVEPLDLEAECAFCSSSVRSRIELNHSGTVVQYDVCLSCAKRWDGVWTEVPPEKKVQSP